MQVWPAASSGWPAARLGPADLDSAGFSAVGRSSWVFGRGPYFAKSGPSSSLVTQKRKLRGSFGRFARRVLFGWLLNEDKLVLAQDTSLDLPGFSFFTTALDIGATARRLRKLKAAVAGALSRSARVHVRSLCSICGQIQSMQLAYGIKCRTRSRYLLLAVRLALAGSPDYDAFVAPGARALEELALWGADIDTSARQPMHVHLRRPDFIIECDASDSALAGIVVRAPEGALVGGQFWRRLGATEATWSSCLREMTGYEFCFATLAGTNDLRDADAEIVGDHRAAAFIFASGGSQCVDEDTGALLITDAMLRILHWSESLSVPRLLQVGAALLRAGRGRPQQVRGYHGLLAAPRAPGARAVCPRQLGHRPFRGGPFGGSSLVSLA